MQLKFHHLPYPINPLFKSIHLKYQNENITRQNCEKFLKEISNITTKDFALSLWIIQWVVGKQISSSQKTHVKGGRGVWSYSEKVIYTKDFLKMLQLDDFFLKRLDMILWVPFFERNIHTRKVLKNGFHSYFDRRKRLR